MGQLIELQRILYQFHFIIKRDKNSFRGLYSYFITFAQNSIWLKFN